MEIALPPAAWLATRYALMIGENSVSLLSWHKGKFTKFGEFVNDNQGMQDLSAYFKKEGAKFTNKNISICVSVVGEDYRFEKVAHLVGKYRTDMLKRKFQQLFRGTTYHMASYQGREPIGRRQDFFLFCGVLSNEKVQPWVREVTRVGMNIAGVHLASFVTGGLLKHVTKDVSGFNIVSTILSAGNIRHNFFIDGKLRFSRLSRLTDDFQPEDIFRSVRSEIEKTVQYLASIKLVQATTKTNVHILCAEDILAQMQELAAPTANERVSINCVSARLVCNVIGVKKPIEEYGRDATLVIHEMLRSVRFVQLASFAQIRYYLIQMSAYALSIAAIVWGSVNLFGTASQAWGAYSQYTGQNASLENSIARLKDDYENQIQGFGVPPSSPENMRSAVNILDSVATETGNKGPGKLLLYISKLLAESPAMQLQEYNWYISNSKGEDTGQFSFANGKQIYEIIEISGVLDENFDAEKAYEQYTSFLDNIEARVDMTVIRKEEPALLEAGGELVVTIGDRSDLRSELNAYTNNRYQILIAWQEDFNQEQQDNS